MIQTKKERQLEELERSIKKIIERGTPKEHGALYTPEKPSEDEERFGFPQELYSIME